MSHWIVVPIVLPAIVASLLLLGLNRETVLERSISLMSTAAMLVVAIALLAAAIHNPPEAYALGNWVAPFGIVMVLDRLSALMLVLTAVLALLVLIYAVHGWDRRGRHFHALFQFQLMGVNGAFLTGDVFNLFVFFEVLLIASYGLMLHGAGAERLKAGTQYVIVNLCGSTLFLFGVALIYGVTGTLNMADLAVKVPQVPAADQGLLQAGGLLLLLVFGVKAALVPLHFWLPGTYAGTSAPVAALFAIMTKVGAYSILRLYTLAFGADASDAAWLAGPWLLPAALVTLALGMVGVLAARSLRWMTGFAVIGSMGTLLIAFGLFTEQSVSAGLYYLLHSTLIAAGLFLLVEQIAIRRGAADDSIALAPRFAQTGLLSALFMMAAISMAGLPPLSGFIGKLLILDAARDSGAMAWIWTIVLATSLLMIFGFARAGSLLFWKSGTVEAPAADSAPVAQPALPLAVAACFIGLTALLTVFAGPVSLYLDETAREIMAPAGYIAAVLGPDALAAR
ncbi:MAG: monovalent cation/H+ antiporter subunit D [Oceanibaculum sp.]